MNFFFGVKSSIINSTLTIPRFQNLSFTKKKYEVFELQINSGKWEFKVLRDIEVNKDFYKIDSSLIKKENIFCLATKNEMLELEKNEFLDKNLLRYMTVRVKKFDLTTNYFAKSEDSEKKTNEGLK